MVMGFMAGVLYAWIGLTWIDYLGVGLTWCGKIIFGICTLCMLKASQPNALILESNK